MALFKKNIWPVFGVLLLLGLVLLGSFSVMRWQELITQYRDNQHAVAQNWFGSYSSLLDQQESIITLLGRQLFLKVQSKNNVVQAELDTVWEINPDIFAGFALFDENGNVLKTSSGLSSANAPNLLELSQTRDSFLYALNSQKMVLGRTYLAPRLVIPARKAIYSENGQLLGVMTGALKLKAEDGFFGRAKVLGDYQRITIIRVRDRYIQYISNQQTNPYFHEKPVNDEYFTNFLNTISNAAVNQSDLHNGIHYRLDSEDGRGLLRGVALYNNRYEFWLISEIEEGFLIKQFMHIFAGYLAVFITFQIVTFLLFKRFDISQKRQTDILEYQANHDPLTGLPNRHYLLSQFEMWAEAKTAFSMLFIDLDNFKGINDSFGHSLGDKLLVNLAKRLQFALSDNELLVRHGGDEFVLLVSGVAQSSMEQNIISNIYKACEDIAVNNMSFSPGVSIGIARYPEHGLELDTLLRTADIAMYEAKKNRNHAYLFNPELEANYLYKARIEQFLRGAHKRGEIYLQYQPQVNGEGELQGVEALARWNSPELGFVPPDIFIDVAEHAGLIGELGDFIIDSALSDITEVQQRSGISFLLSVNISFRQLIAKGFAEKLIAKVAESGLSAIRIEITESVLIDDFDKVRLVLQMLKAQNITVSLDDFGTGYSSLSVLRNLKFDELKIDKSFVDNVVSDETALQMVRNIMSIGQNYKVTVLAEGVENVSQLECLLASGCDRFQGYFFSRPLLKANLYDYITR